MVVAQVADDGLRRVAAGSPGKRRGEHREVAGLVDDGLDGAEAAVVLERSVRRATPAVTAAGSAGPSITICTGLVLPREKSRSRTFQPCLA